MADDKSNRGGSDRKRIDVSQDYECLIGPRSSASARTS